MTAIASLASKNPELKDNHSSQNTVLLVFLPVKPEARDTFRKMLFEIAEHIAKEPDFVSATVHEDMDDPDTLLIYETWSSSREYLLEHHLSKPYRKIYEAQLTSMLKAERRIVFLRAPIGTWAKA
jgi:quinol monooxygenase YgiN